ncbi:hypothetical protein ARMGADRAFT_249873 [Armillaria gallica]|uniref:Uncharacterized protein n=1 Tax=Armillaria gallica TaxID=47427 RepID=A0A2H3E4G2_ARMGA|nr:hypothetical protein ARMGADRAFT_249873 [Armillaria gallica]
MTAYPNTFNLFSAGADTNRHMDKPGLLLHFNIVSLCNTLALCLLSALDLGVLSLWANPAVGILTLAYNITLLLRWYRETDDALALEVFYSVYAVVYAGLLCTGWILAFIIMTLVAWDRPQGTVVVWDIDIRFPEYVVYTQRLQFLLTSLQFALFGDLTIRGFVLRRRTA